MNFRGLSYHCRGQDRCLYATTESRFLSKNSEKGTIRIISSEALTWMDQKLSNPLRRGGGWPRNAN